MNFKYLKSRIGMSSKFFSTATKLGGRKDYYAILGINKNSSLEEIKKAYRMLAKKYHPDVSTQRQESEKTNVEMFRDIAEAYAVLSNETMKFDYDTRFKVNPDAIYNAEKMKKMKESQRERDMTGNIPRPDFGKGTYGDFRQEKLKELKKKFNFDHLGNFKGGVPRKNKLNIRGGAMGPPGSQYDQYFHNELYADNPAVKPVSTEEVSQHKIYHHTKKEQYTRFKPYFNLEEVEMDHQYNQRSEYRFLILVPISLLGLYIMYSIIQRKLLDDHFYYLEDKVKSLKAHEYEVRGPVVLEADKFKFSQKYLTREEYHKWLENDIRTFK